MIPMAAAALAILALLGRFFDPLGGFDESLLLTNAFLLKRGAVVYRDFYTNYPPGILYLTRILSETLGSPIWSIRVGGLCVRLATAAVAGLLVRRIHGRPGVCLWTLAAVLLVQVSLGLLLFAYPVALLIGLVAALSWPKTGAHPARYVLAGSLLALASWFRHDLFTYSIVALMGLEGLHGLIHRRPLLVNTYAQLRLIGVGVAAAGLGLWLPVVIRAGFSRPLHDLVIDQAVKTMPARRLPLPAAWGFSDLHTVPLQFCLLVLVIAFVIGGIGTIVRVCTEPQTSERSRAMAILFALCCAAVPQAFQRVDVIHAAYGAPVALIVVMTTINNRAWLRDLLFLLATFTLFCYPLGLIELDAITSVWKHRTDDYFVSAERREFARSIQKEVKEGEPIFVGCDNHRRVTLSYLDPYYLAQRPGATRYMQFDPGLTTSVEAQREMITDLDRSRPKLALRYSGCYWTEPNQSSVVGSDLLDRFLAERYENQGEVWLGVHVWRLRTIGKK